MALTQMINLRQKPHFIRGYQIDMGCPCVVFTVEINEDTSALKISLDEVSAKFSQLTGLEISQVEQLKVVPDSRLLQFAKLMIGWSLALQKAAGWPNFYTDKDIRVRQIGEKNMFSLRIPCADGHQLYASQAFQWLVSVFNKILNHQDLTADEKNYDRVLKSLMLCAPQGMNTKNFIESAVKLGIPWRYVHQNVVQYGWGSQSHWMDSSFTENTSLIATRLARNKFSAADVLRKAGIPVPEHILVTDIDNALKAANMLGYPVVVKPADQDGGSGVAAGLKDEDALRSVFPAARKLSKQVLIEKHIEGNDYRLQVFRGKLIWVSHRQPGGVTGDGKSTVKQLLEILNNEPLRGEPGSQSSLKRIHLDDEAKALLQEQGLKVSSKPNAGEFIRLRRTANVATGGKPIAIDLNEVHPDNKRLAEQAAKALRLDMAGVDLIIPDIRRSWLETGGAICEVNAQPQVWPKLTLELLKKLTYAQGRIPVIFLLGTQQQREWISKLAGSFGEIGCRVGIADRNQAVLGRDLIMRNSHSLFDSAQALLMNRQVDCLLVCVDDFEIASTGLPCDKFDVLVLLDSPEAVDQKKWLDFARMLRHGCTGTTMMNEDSEQLNSMPDNKDKDLFKAMTLEHIHHLLKDGFQKVIRK